MHDITDRLIQLPTLRVPVASLAKEYTEVLASKELRFCDHNIKQEPNDDQNTPPFPPTGCYKDLSKTSENDKKEKKKSNSRSPKTSPCK